ncbi:mitochondrial fission process protein 1 [Anabrus simplex]|uniref:mitochondrial fission process protein 1 n=1 Tax=Anabrus simplex TaxID=316456 RepID=UPI0034DD2471
MSESQADLFRDTPVRLIGYANEVGEAFRPLVHVFWVRLSYGIASAYVVADTIHKTVKMNQKEFESEKARRFGVFYAATDTLLWQSLASVIIPGFTINRICAGSLYLLNRTTKLPQTTRKWITTAIGLSCIPFIFKPIDNFVDYTMDNTIRKLTRQSS